MKNLLVGTFALLSVPFLLASRPAQPVERFQLSLERTAKGWVAQCDTGCDWTALSVSCANDCRVLIDAAGVTANVTARETEAAFGFVLSRADKGWQAESVAGTAWSKVSWDCLTGRCRVRLDERGVSGLPPWP